MQQFDSLKNYSIEQLSGSFQEMQKWLKSSKTSPVSGEVELHWALALALLTDRHFAASPKDQYFQHLHNLKAVFSRHFKQSPTSLLPNLGLGICNFLQCRCIDLSSDVHQQAYMQLLLNAQEKFNLIFTAISKPNKLSLVENKILKNCYVYLVRTKALLSDYSPSCVICLLSAKLNHQLTLEEFTNNPDFKTFVSKEELMNIMKEDEVSSAERLAFEEDRRSAHSEPERVSLEKSMTESQLIKNALSTSTLDFLTQQKLPLAINLRDFFQPVINTLHNESQARLKKRLTLYGVAPKREIPGDGNCQMHSLSDQLCGNLNHSKFIRKTLLNWLRTHADVALPNGCTLKDFVHDKTWDEYCTKMSQSGEWGDHLTLIAAAEVFSTRIVVISSAPGDNYIIEIIPTFSIPHQTIFLSHFAEFHYGSVYPIQ
uniref:OTU domain-containing protein n=1 Tax=Arcella intermedia TaxID=1963864 RepID=A0A6B2L4L7_9EUKA